MVLKSERREIMTDDISRRGFLKGLMAAAAVTAFVPVLPAIAEPVAPEPEETKFPLTEPGDLWLKGRFIGKIRSLTVIPDVVETTSLESYGGFRSFAAVRQPHDYRFELFLDHPGRDLLREMSLQAEYVEVLVGAQHGACRCDKALLRSHRIQIVSGPREIYYPRERYVWEPQSTAEMLVDHLDMELCAPISIYPGGGMSREHADD